MQKNTVVLTREGYEELKTEYETLVKEKRAKVVERIDEARSHGDLSENEAYQQARRDQLLIEDRIEELEQILKDVQIVEQTTGGKVRVGSKVTLRNGKNTQVYQVVGEHEADITVGKISHTSPIGEALMGKEVGAEIEVAVPAGKAWFEITQIDNT